MNKPVLKDVLPLYTGVSHSYENDPGMVSWVKFGEMWVFSKLRTVHMYL